MPDIYDAEIARLSANPDDIYDSWVAGKPLFAVLPGTCVCLTILRNCSWSPKDKIQTAIKSDERIPKHVQDIKVSDLPVFAEWQRRLDATLTGE